MEERKSSCLNFLERKSRSEGSADMHLQRRVNVEMEKQ